MTAPARTPMLRGSRLSKAVEPLESKNAMSQCGKTTEASGALPAADAPDPRPPDAGRAWDPEAYARHAAYVPETLGAPVLDLLAPQPDERILDLGCGDGALTERLAAAGARVVGVDAAPEMVTRAAARGLDARVGDAAALRFDGAFDAVFSNAALHWVRDHDGVLAGVRRALKPGGRFVGECGAHGNVAAVRVALIAVLDRRGLDGAALLPWHFPTAEAFAARLVRHGFAVDRIESLPRPMRLPTGMAGWLETFAAGPFGRLPEAERAAAREEAIALLRPVLCDEDGTWTADYVRLRFAARREG
jgi:trans-aconitate methyltransferase